MATTRVVVGVAGAGKTQYAMDIVENALKSGVKWYEIGFFSFSRAACLEAAERAAAVTGVPPEKMQADGFFRTIHSSALRLLGVDAKVLIDPERAKDKAWFADKLGTERGGERGTLADLTGQTLDKWDQARSRLQTVICEQKRSTTRPIDGCTEQVDTVNVTVIPLATQSEWDQVKSCNDMDLRSENREVIPLDPTQNAVTVITAAPHKMLGEMPCSVPENPSIYMGREFSAGLPGESESSRRVGSVIFESATVSPIYTYGDPTHIGVSGIKCDHVDVSPCGERGKGDPTHLFLSYEDGQLIRKYEDAKRLEGRLDFQDLLLRYAGVEYSVHADRMEPKQGYSAGSVPEELRVILVDEYQDCSALLDAVVERLASKADDLWLLGDRYQAIYGFAGSDWRIMASREAQAKAEGLRTLLNRSWRNPPEVLDWGEQVLRQDPQYDDRQPMTEVGSGSVGFWEAQWFFENLETLAKSDTMILSRTWFGLERVQKQLDQRGIPWRSCGENARSRWDAPVRIAFVLVMMELEQGLQISESDWRRVTAELPQKFDGEELFVRGIKAKWAKMECSNERQKTLDQVGDWGGCPKFVEMVRKGYWRHDAAGLIARAIETHGIDVVRKPRIRLGTVHSVKGMQAKTVVCLATSTEKASGQNADWYEELFLKYVAITRASRHYRVVIDPVDVARGRTLFLACPEIPLRFVNEPVGVEDADEVSEVDFGAEGLLGSEVSGRDLREVGDAGRVDRGERSLSGDRVESSREETDQAADGDGEADPFGWITI